MANFLELVSKNPPGFYELREKETDKLLGEGEVRQCCHCRGTWMFRKGSGRRRGYCYLCQRITCGKPICDMCYTQEQRLDDIEAEGRKLIEATVRRQQLRELMDQYTSSGGYPRIRQ